MLDAQTLEELKFQKNTVGTSKVTVFPQDTNEVELIIISLNEEQPPVSGY